MLGAHVRFQPNVELGFGEHVDLYTLNAEAAHRFSERWDAWSPYLGGGLGTNIRRYDTGSAHGNNNSDTELGVNLLGGVETVLLVGGVFAPVCGSVTGTRTAREMGSMSMTAASYRNIPFPPS